MTTPMTSHLPDALLTFRAPLFVDMAEPIADGLAEAIEGFSPRCPLCHSAMDCSTIHFGAPDLEQKDDCMTFKCGNDFPPDSACPGTIFIYLHSSILPSFIRQEVLDDIGLTEHRRAAAPTSPIEN